MGFLQDSKNVNFSPEMYGEHGRDGLPCVLLCSGMGALLTSPLSLSPVAVWEAGPGVTGARKPDLTLIC